MDHQDNQSLETFNNFYLISNLLILIICLVGFSYILTTLPGEIPSDPNRTCITGGWKFLLILTHILPFAVIPLTMYVFYRTLSIFKNSSKRIFRSQLGLAFLMVAIASEIGSHVTQCWYYENEFTMLNFMFYFFLIAAFALWADSLVQEFTRQTQIINLLLTISLLIISFLYPLGDQADNTSYKIPIYLILTLVFILITYRGYKLIDSWKILLVPFFSIGVNLGFIALLFAFGGDPYTNPQIARNALFHILHDLAGTQMGVIIFTALVYNRGAKLRG
ncbi:MAG: hypothetical protein ACLFQP_04495 [Halothece sp.]